MMLGRLFLTVTEKKTRIDSKSWRSHALSNGSDETVFNVISVNHLGNIILYEANQTTTLFSCVSLHGIPADYTI